MAYSLGYNLSDLSFSIIKTLFIYRGMTATQIASLLHPYSYTLAQEKSIYNYLGKLKKQKLVTSMRIRDGYSRGSIYYLTHKGYEFAKNWMDIQEGQQGEGWILCEDSFSLFADIPYEIYTPPLEQTAHHLLLIDFFIQFKRLEMEHLELNHRLNLYASSNYVDDSGKFRFRPDSEIKLSQDRRYTIEIDRGTESHEQLRRKFRTYRQYFDFLSKQDIEKIPDGIIFVVEEKRRDHGIKRRWLNIASAYFQEIGAYHHKVNLIMTSMDKVTDTISFEEERRKYEVIAINASIQDLSKNYDVHNFTYGKDKFSVAIKDDDYYLYYSFTSHMFETALYSKYLRLKPSIQKIVEVPLLKDKTLNDINKLVYYKGGNPFLIENFNSYEMEPQLQKSLEEVYLNTSFFQFRNDR